MADVVLRVKSRLRPYEVHFVADCARAIGNQKKNDAFLIVDEGLPSKNKITRLFAAEKTVYFKANEKNKTLASAAALIQELLDRKIKRNCVIYAVGGGIVEDVVAFVSTILFRGVNWVFCPTTLLAQADSCIGSKSSINFGGYKNLLGFFNPPHQVILDVKFLKSLPVTQVKSGIGEILHFYLVAGKHALAGQMMGRYDFYLKNPMSLRPFIKASLETKKAVIERDEFDQGERNLFNYGHTFGHALEAVTNYRISHGRAVTLGMDLANYLSWQLGHIDEKTFLYLRSILTVNIPMVKLRVKDMEEYFEALSKDKKNVGAKLVCILTAGRGRMFKASLNFDAALKKKISSYFFNKPR